jgi:hypothetical protein
MLAIGEDLVLVGQVGAAGIDEVDAGQSILRGDLLGAQVLLDRHRVVRAALNGRVVAHDHDFATFDSADTGYYAGAGAGAIVHVVCRQCPHFEKRRARIDQVVDAMARQHLAARGVTGAGLLAAAFHRGVGGGPDFREGLPHGGGAGLEVSAAGRN